MAIGTFKEKGTGIVYERGRGIGGAQLYHVELEPYQ